MLDEDISAIVVAFVVEVSVEVVDTVVLDDGVVRGRLCLE